jgi:hypothetical protein
MSKPIYHSVLDDTFKRPWHSARLFVDKIPFGTTKEELTQFFTLRHDPVLFNKPVVAGTQFPSVDIKWNFIAKLSSYDIPLIIKLNHNTKNRLNIELGIYFYLFVIRFWFNFIL